MNELTALCPAGWPNAYLHLLSPFAIQFTESFGIRWYGLAYLAGFYLGYLAIIFLSHNKRIALKASLASDFVFTAALGVVIGGRLGYCILYQPEHLISFSAAFPFWKVLAINEGGMASHGGILGMMIAIWYFARKQQLSFVALLDLTSIGGTIGIFFGRLANFVNGELLGRIAPPCYRYAVKFPTELNDPLLIESARSGVPEAIATLHQTLAGRYPSQLFEAGLEGLLPFLVLLYLWRKPQKPGVIAASFLLIYPIGRFLGENYRMPDAHIGFEALGFTRGQWLSVAMMVASIVLATKWLRSSAAPHGGWLRNSSPVKELKDPDENKRAN